MYETLQVQIFSRGTCKLINSFELVVVIAQLCYSHSFHFSPLFSSYPGLNLPGTLSVVFCCLSSTGPSGFSSGITFLEKVPNEAVSCPLSRLPQHLQVYVLALIMLCGWF